MMKNELIDAIFALKPLAVKLGFDYPCLSLGVKTEVEELGYYTDEELSSWLKELAAFIEAAVCGDTDSEAYDKWIP